MVGNMRNAESYMTAVGCVFNYSQGVQRWGWW